MSVSSKSNDPLSHGLNQSERGCFGVLSGCSVCVWLVIDVFQACTQNFSPGGADPEAIYNLCLILKTVL
jgi:hypothetical protein